VQPKVRIPEKDEKEIAEAVLLLKKRALLKERNQVKDFHTKAVIELKLAAMSEHVRSRAEAYLRGENRPVQSLKDAAQNPGDANEVRREWAEVIKEYDEKKAKWAKPALASEIEFQKAVVNYSVAITPLIEAFDSAKSSNIDGVKARAAKASGMLSAAQRSLIPLSSACSDAQDELKAFFELVDYLKTKPPKSLVEVKGARVSFDEAIQKVRSTEQAIEAQVTAINQLAKKQQKELEGLIRDMVAAAVAWAKTENVREGAEVVESLLNGVVNAVQALDSEPMSALAVQGLHSLIKGLSDGVKLSAAGIKTVMLKQDHKHDVLGLIDKLEADDFIQAKLDLIKMGLSWLVEPLGLIPNVGAIVRTAANLGFGLVVGTLKKAAAKQAAAMEKKSGKVNVDAEIKEAAEIIRESTLGYVKAALEGAVKALAKPEEAAGEFLMSVLGEVLGPPLEKLVAEVVGEFDLVDKEQVKATVEKSWAALEAQKKELQAMVKIDKSFGFDEEAAKAVTLKNLDGLAQGTSCRVVVAASPQLETTRGVAVLIGDGHGEDNVSFVTSLVKAGQGCQGTVLMKEKGGAVFAGELVFTFSDDKAEAWVRSYVSHYGSGITRKKLTFR
jgi:tRNA G18 (ribose-2'-O)-methylase SpoU